MNCRVSDDQTESYLSATRSQPSCSKRVNSAAPFLMAEAKCLPLFEGQFDWLFLLAGNKPVSLNDPSACVPAEQSVIIAGPTDCFRFFKPVHGFAKKIVRLKPATGCVLHQLCLGTAFGKNSRVISTLIFAVNAPEQLFDLNIAHAISLRETIS